MLREIGLSRAAAFLGGALFLLCPVFFLTPHAAIGPVPFLPLLLLGIEHAARAAAAGRRMGWSLVTVAVAYSIYARFPEIAFLDGLFAGFWVLWRLACLPGPVRMGFIGKLGLATGIGICLSLPLVVPFLDYLKRANLSGY